MVALTEKPASPRSHWAVPGVYFYGPEVCDDAARLRPGVRGELEITDLNRVFLERGDLEIELLGRGITWFDMGTPRDLLAAANFVASLQTRQGLMIGCIEEVALRRGWIERADVASAARLMGLSPYAEYLDRLLVEL